jgi:L-ascorbate metabolism protein UlaG (beta-lactamase superfamily)
MAAPLTVTWLGHATVLIEVDGARVLTDPALRTRLGPLVRVAPSVPADAVGTVDCVLLSHLHYDHTDLPTLRNLGRSTPIIVPSGARGWLSGRGFTDVRQLSPGESLGIGALRITATPATHDPRRRPFGPAAPPIGFMIGASRSAYFAGDTDLFAAMEDMRGAVDVALLPVWGWGARLGPGHLDPERAAIAAALIAPAVAIPIHWGTFALGRAGRGQPDPERPAREFAAQVSRRAPSVDVRVLAPGQTTSL